MPDMNSPEERRTRLRRWLVGVLLLLLLIGVPLTAVYLDSTGSQDLAEAMSAADRDDPYWRLNDLMAHRETDLADNFFDSRWIPGERWLSVAPGSICGNTMRAIPS